MSIIKLTLDSYKAEVEEADKPVLIDFFATWCGPCKMLSPLVDEIAAENDGVKVCKVNVDQEPELAERFGVYSIPTLVVVKEGEVKAQAVGYQTKDAIAAMLN